MSEPQAASEEHGRVGMWVYGARCGRRKKPHGRSAPIGDGGYCDEDCRRRDYQEEPLPGCLWPGETCEDFGFAHCHHATQVAA